VNVHVSARFIIFLETVTILSSDDEEPTPDQSMDGSSLGSSMDSSLLKGKPHVGDSPSSSRAATPTTLNQTVQRVSRRNLMQDEVLQSLAAHFCIVEPSKNFILGIIL